MKRLTAPARRPAAPLRHPGGRTRPPGLRHRARVGPAAGVVVDHPHPGWRDVPVRAILESATRLPVQVDSHSRALRASGSPSAGSANAS
ncbi:hypothetical protein ACFWVT_16315 [Streptomyces cyaneofuscatus]|uniref:hypothetical protein n=1 Tax=Streptomyces cyaneofuscatus TaxID=66883 RepID=UPI0036575464